MANSLQTVQDKINLAVTAQEADDFTTALRYVRSAQMLLATLPSRVKHGDNEVEFLAETLSALAADLSRQQAVSVGVRQTKIEWQRPDADEDA